jgi:hypothetical protein
MTKGGNSASRHFSKYSIIGPNLVLKETIKSVIDSETSQ